MNRLDDAAALGVPGELVTASISNPLENAASRGKVRPVVLVRRDGGAWLVAGLTTSALYRTGGARTPVPNPTAVGLRGPGYLWGAKLTRVCALDIDRHIGWVDAALAAVIIRQACLRPDDAAALVLAVERAHAA